MVHWSCWMTLCILGPAWLRRPENGFRIASSWLSWAKMGPTWSQVGSKLAQVGVMLGPNWLQVGSSWAMLAPSWLPLKNPPCGNMPHPSSWPQVGSMLAPCCLHVGSMLAPCWLHVGSCWLHVGSCWTKWPPRWPHMAPSWPKLASRCHYVGSSWPQDAQNGFQWPNFIICWPKIAHSGTPWICKILKKPLVL